jgi:hypothetical protein
MTMFSRPNIETLTQRLESFRVDHSVALTKYKDARVQIASIDERLVDGADRSLFTGDLATAGGGGDFTTMQRSARLPGQRERHEPASTMTLPLVALTTRR